MNFGKSNSSYHLKSNCRAYSNVDDNTGETIDHEADPIHCNQDQRSTPVIFSPTKTFELSKERFTVALLPNIGRFCKCGCGKRIEGVLVIKHLKHSTVRYRRKAPINKIFANQSCKNKYISKFRKRVHNRSLYARVSLVVEYDGKQPYFEIRVYKKKGIKQSFKITPKQKELFSFIESIAKFRDLKSEQSLIKRNSKNEDKTKTVEALQID